MVEQLTVNQLVIGSSPIAGAPKNEALISLFLLTCSRTQTSLFTNSFLIAILQLH